MTDFDYDVLQRKRLAGQAKYKKNGSRSRKCTLSQDHMTDAQLRKRNGKVVGFAMNEPIWSWKDFKEISRASAIEYVTGLDKKYDVSINDLAKMFGVTYNTVREYLRLISCPLPHGQMPREKRDEWQRFLNTTPEEPEKAREPEVEEKAEPEFKEDIHTEGHSAVPENELPMKLREFTLEFVGKLELDGIMNSLRYMLGDSSNGTLKVTFSADRNTCNEGNV